ncbi:unnamed protein product [Medioppia subpectinata]|uniref:Riboflavin transporter n=1 Tax=Medioppia subpectinata TaxID=1979941 RepID=A0A7R9LS08_9ACAR|nr:unnamed protein product [Medioppia subpectinata]CAG2121184.1 unnamed protein product [Medioppia subpectinata]
MAHFKSKYLMSYLIGQGLSGLIPSIVAIIQGIGGNPECVAPTAGANTTVAHYPEPRFSVSVFFIFLLVMVLLSWFAFVLLNHLKACQSERVTHKDDSEVENQLKAVTETVRSDSSSDKGSDELQLNSESFLNRSNDRNISRNAFAGLLLTQAYICALTNGVLPSIQSYSCLPYGNTAYHLTVTLSSMANPIACFVAFYMSASVIKKTLPAVVGVGTLCAVYIIVTAVMSPTPPLQDSTSGKVLVIIVWIAFTSLFSYSRACIATILRNTSTGHKSLFFCGVFTQIGSTIGAVFMFILTNFTAIFVPFFPCK